MINRRDILKGLVAAPVLLQVPSDRKDIITFAEEKEIITSVIDSDLERLGPDRILSWTNEVDHNVRTPPQLGYLERYDHAQLGRRTVEGSISMYMTPQNLMIVNMAIRGDKPLRMMLPTEMEGIRSTEFLALVTQLEVSGDYKSDMIVNLNFVVVGDPPQFYEVT